MIGTILDGRYRIISKLGAGGMGEVYLAEHINLGRKEAIKILHPQLAVEAQFVARFRREARAVNRLQHPNIVGVYDFGKLPDGRFFLSLEYAEGRQLGRQLKEAGPFPVTRALMVLQQLAEAVDHAHACGVVHRDLKPENLILVDRPNHADVLKVLDFGIAKIIAPDHVSTNLTAKGEIFGTVQYMAPELFLDSKVDTRVDLYAIGCIAFELVVGQPPFVGRTIEVTSAHISTAPDHPSARQPAAHLPREYDELVARCLAKDPDQRFQTARDLLAAIKRVPGYRPHKPTTGRRQSYRALPQIPEFEVEETEERTLARPLPDHTGESLLPEEDEGAAITSEIGVDDLKLAVQGTLRELGETLVDLGYTHAPLLIALNGVREAEDEMLRCDSEAAALEARANELERLGREREGSLRFAIGELRFVVTQAIEQKAPVDELQAQIEELERRLQRVNSELEREQSENTDRAISMAAARAGAAEHIDELCRAIEQLTAHIEPSFSDHPSVRSVLGRLAAFRRMGAPPRRPRTV